MPQRTTIPRSARDYVISIVQDKLLQLKSESASPLEIQRAQQAFDLLMSMEEFKIGETNKRHSSDTD